MKSWYQERNAPKVGTFLCELKDIVESEIMEFTFGEHKKTWFRMFIYNDKGILRAYMNMCPHYDVPLNVEPGEMFTSDRTQFMCMMHYARFNLNDGHCTDGPCKGLSLEAIPLLIDNDKVFIGDVDSG